MPTKTHIIISVAIHAAAVIVLLVNTNFGSHKWREADELLPETELVESKTSIASNSSTELMNETGEIPDHQNIVKIQYRGAPSRGGETTIHQPSQKPNRSAQSLTTDPLYSNKNQITSTKSPEFESLRIPADVLREEGLQAPAFAIKDLSVTQMNQIRKNHQGAVVVICDTDIFRVRGPIQNPSDLTLVKGKELAFLSQRALIIPSESCRAIRDKLQWEFAVSPQAAERAKIRLLLTNTLDRLILRHQKEALNPLGLNMEDVLRTTGKFSFSKGRVVDFHIESLMLQDGQLLSVEAGEVEESIDLSRVIGKEVKEIG